MLPTTKVARLLALGLVLPLGGLGCDLARTVAAAAPDAAADTDTDTDGDADGDGDTDVDTDGDTDTEPGVIEMDCTACPAVGGSLENLMCAIDLCDGDVVQENGYLSLNGELVGCDLEDTRLAVERFGDDGNDLPPRLGDSYALIASGLAGGTAHSTSCSDGTSAVMDQFSEEEPFIHDAMQWQLVLEAPSLARAFRFSYVFFSEEYDEFISTPYNDKFYVIIESGNTNGGQPTVINFTECRDPDTYIDFTCPADADYCVEGEDYCYIAINTAHSECCWYDGCPDGVAETDIAGTGFECATGEDADGETTGSSTGWLKTSWPIEGGELFKLTFQIHDTSDGVFDSEALIDSFVFLTDAEQGTVPIE